MTKLELSQRAARELKEMDSITSALITGWLRRHGNTESEITEYLQESQRKELSFLLSHMGMSFLLRAHGCAPSHPLTSLYKEMAVHGQSPS